MTGVPYLDAVSEAYKLAKHEHRSQIRAESFPAWESGPVHAFSRAVGAMETLRDLEPLASDDLLYVNRFQIREQARLDAVHEFEEERREEWEMRRRLERSAA